MLWGYFLFVRFVRFVHLGEIIVNVSHTELYECVDIVSKLCMIYIGSRYICALLLYLGIDRNAKESVASTAVKD